MTTYFPVILVLVALICNAHCYQKSLIHSRLGNKVSFSAHRLSTNGFLHNNVVGTMLKSRVQHYRHIFSSLASGMMYFIYELTKLAFTHSFEIVFAGKIYKDAKKKVKNSLIYLGLCIFSLSRIVSPSGSHSPMPLVIHSLIFSFNSASIRSFSPLILYLLTCSTFYSGCCIHGINYVSICHRLH